MPDVLSNDDLDALAAEYVLGTLDAEERRGAAALLEVDPSFRGTVRIWERRFSELHLMVEPVEPSAAVWERIRSKLGDDLKIPAAAEISSASAEADTTSAEIQPADAAVAEDKPPETTPAATSEASPEATAETAPEATSETAETTEPAEPAEAVADAPADGVAESAPSLVPEESPPRAVDEVPRGGAVPPRFVTREEVEEEEEAEVAERPAGPGRGWVVVTVLAVLIALLQVLLIAGWRFFPDRLPPQLQATSILRISDPTPEPEPEPSPPPLPPAKRPPMPSFDE